MLRVRLFRGLHAEAAAVSPRAAQQREVPQSHLQLADEAVR